MKFLLFLIISLLSISCGREGDKYISNPNPAITKDGVYCNQKFIRDYNIVLSEWQKLSLVVNGGAIEASCNQGDVTTNSIITFRESYPGFTSCVAEENGVHKPVTPDVFEQMDIYLLELQKTCDRAATET